MRTYLAVALLAALCGCHNIRFEVADGPVERTVYERKSFYFWGLTPKREVDVSQQCPAGVASVREQTQVSDGFLALVTFGIWQPRSSWYHCLATVEK